MKKIIIPIFVIILMISTAYAATLSCQQVSSTTLSVPQFSSKEIEIKCTATGGTVSSIQITPNANPPTGLTISSTQTMSSSLADSGSGTAKWSITGDTPNSYDVSYLVSSDGTTSWTTDDETQVTVSSVARLTVDYTLPPSIFIPTLETLDYQITNIGGTTANNINMKFYYNNALVATADYPLTLGGNGASTSQSWTNETGFNQSGSYKTEVYIGEMLHDSVTATVSAAGTNITQAEGWNLISLSRVPTNLSPASVYADIYENLTRIWEYSPAGGWKMFSTSGTDQIGEMNISLGYWAQMNSPAPLTVSGESHAGGVLSLTSGWNLVGYPATEDGLNVNDTIQPIVDDLDIIWEYTASGGWKWFNPATYTNGVSSYIQNFTHGKGYWYKVSSNTALTLP
ncbi:MAG: hypothetical protein KKF44_02745 [Nanoarchaeota archaeon]|nr:hypothetical protein [Nanoarchaeota archaeon]